MIQSNHRFVSPLRRQICQNPMFYVYDFGVYPFLQMLQIFTDLQLQEEMKAFENEEAVLKQKYYKKSWWTTN